MNFTAFNKDRKHGAGAARPETDGCRDLEDLGDPAADVEILETLRTMGQPTGAKGNQTFCLEGCTSKQKRNENPGNGERRLFDRCNRLGVPDAKLARWPPRCSCSVGTAPIDPEA